MSLLSNLNRYNVARLEELTPNQNNWILHANYRQIINHTGRVVLEVDPSSKKTIPSTISSTDHLQLSYIFFNHMETDKLIALVLVKSTTTDDDDGIAEPNDKYRLLLIKNRCYYEEKEGDDDNLMVLNSNGPQIKSIDSVLIFLSSLDDLVNHIDDKELVNEWWKEVSSSSTTASSKKQRRAKKDLNLSIPFPLRFLLLQGDLGANNNDAKRKSLLYDWITKEGQVSLDFSKLMVDDRLIEHLPASFPMIKRLRFNQNVEIGAATTTATTSNNNIDSFTSLLLKFPEVILLEIEQCQQINATIFEKICKALPKLKVLTLTNNVQLDANILPLIFQYLPKLEVLQLNFEHFRTTTISQDQRSRVPLVDRQRWKGLPLSQLKTIDTNSDDLGLDIVYHLVTLSPQLVSILVTDKVLDHISKKLLYGGVVSSTTATSSSSNANQKVQTQQQQQPHIITFRTKENEGIVANRPFLFKDMYPEEREAIFSESMLKIIEKNGGANKIDSALWEAAKAERTTC